MLQRNTGPYPLILPTLDPPQTVAPGDVLDHPVLLAGFEEIPEPPAKPDVARPAASPKPAPAAPPAGSPAEEA